MIGLRPGRVSKGAIDVCETPWSITSLAGVQLIAVAFNLHINGLVWNNRRRGRSKPIQVAKLDLAKKTAIDYAKGNPIHRFDGTVNCRKLLSRV
jgi:hypothetical protein